MYKTKFSKECSYKWLFLGFDLSSNYYWHNLSKANKMNSG